MNQTNQISTLFYRWRYLLGYIGLGLLSISALVAVALYLPGGLSNAEIASVINSGNVNILDFSNIINWPYHLLQRVSIELLGVSILGVKLPSIILAFLSACGLLFILKYWFKTNIAILTSLIAIATGQFLFVAQNGTPDVMFIFWPICLILLANIITSDRHSNIVTTVLFCALAALSLYTPASLYVLLAFLLAILLHPRLRCIFKKIPLVHKFIGLVVALVILTPIIMSIVSDISVVKSLLAIPDEFPNLINNLKLLSNQFFNFLSSADPTVITPFFSLASMLIILIGIYYLIRTRTTAKNYIISIWLIVSIPILVFNPSYTSITFLPLVFLLAAGLKEILLYWYGLFPRNPYARVIGLIPITILVLSMILTGMYRYIHEYTYNPKLVQNFSYDLRLLPDDTNLLVVSPDEVDFYNTVSRFSHSDIAIINELDETSTNITMTKQAKQSIDLDDNYQITDIITSHLSNDSDRFYILDKVD